MEELSTATRTGLVSLFRNKVESNWLAQSFPETCYDGNGVVSTNTAALRENLAAVIPGLTWPFNRLSADDDVAVLDLMEYACDHVQLPKRAQYHEYLKHWELTFDAHAGRSRFRADVNRILQRGGSVFELTESNRIRRNGYEETTAALSALRQSSGNDGLDELVEQGRTMYLSHRPEDRQLAMERLWDAFERLKTIEPGTNKKAQIAALVSHIESDAFRAVVDDDMAALTKIGNTFEIRHRETNTHPVPGDASDYLVGRMALVIGYLIQVRNHQPK